MQVVYARHSPKTRQILRFLRTSVTIHSTLPKTVTDESLNNVTEATINLIDIALSGFGQAFYVET